MNYLKLYNQIISNRQLNPYPGYTETHHIVPVSLGGSNTKNNLVALTAREHFICHWLLVKMNKYNGEKYYKMLKAFNLMCNASSINQDRYRVNSRVFSYYREELSRAMSQTQCGVNNSQHGKMWICNLVTKENKKIVKGPIPDGWVVGRNKWKPKPARKRKPPKLISRKYKYGYNVSVNGVVYESISQAADALGILHETARMRFKSNSFPEYKILSR